MARTIHRTAFVAREVLCAASAYSAAAVKHICIKTSCNEDPATVAPLERVDNDAADSSAAAMEALAELHLEPDYLSDSEDGDMLNSALRAFLACRAAWLTAYEKPFGWELDRPGDAQEPAS